MTSIGTNAFQNCTSLASITFPEGVVSIGDNAFKRCTGLESITFPSSLKSLGMTAFSGCSSLKSVTFPDGMETIGNGAFSLCSSLTEVSIPSSVTSIGMSAFGGGCTNLTTVKVDIKTPLPIAQYTFYNRKKATLYVPKGCKAAYQAADYWKEFKEIVEMEDNVADINRDGDITIADVTALVNIILGKDGVEPYQYNHVAADVNGDGDITIADVTALVNVILGK